MGDLKDMTLQDLIRWQQGLILLAIPTGQFNQAVADACYMALRWKAAQPAAGGA